MPRVAYRRESKEYSRLLRVIRGYTKSTKDLAERIGSERTTLGKKLKGDSPLTLLEFITIVQELEIPVEELKGE